MATHIFESCSDGATEHSSFADFLAIIADDDSSTPDHLNDPGSAFRFVYDAWVKRGGYSRGKPRHGIRQIKEWLDDRDVRSLETKLAGKTWLQYQDALNLLVLFLQRWTYDAASNRYEAYADSDFDALARSFLDELLPNESKALLLPARSRRAERNVNEETVPTSIQPASIEFTKPAGETIANYFSESNVLVTISRARTIVGASPADAMTGFHCLMERLFEIDRNDQQKRALAWIIDLGLRNDKVAARGAIYNVHFLAAQFQSIALVQRRGREELFNWLRGHICVILGSLERSEINEIYDHAGIRLPSDQHDLRWFQSDRLFLESVPRRWLDQPGSEIFGAKQSDLWSDPTITAHLRLNDWNLDHSPEIDVRRNLRYLYHGVSSPCFNNELTSQVRCIDLPEPGSRWSDAFRMAIQASLGRLDRQWDERISAISPYQALSQLRDQSFAVLRLDEFLRFPDFLIQNLNSKFSSRESLAT